MDPEHEAARGPGARDADPPRPPRSPLQTVPALPPFAGDTQHDTGGLAGAGGCPAEITALSELGPGARLGQYEVIRELGRGGMGVVYLGRDPRLGRRVAIKVLAHADRAHAERYLHEARLTARCQHDAIVHIFDVGEAPGCSFMVLEYLEGSTLREWLRDRWRLSDAAPRAAGAARDASVRVSPSLAVELMVPVVRALAHAHAQGLVHRDLKPENVMLLRDGSVKVLDFGIARVLDRASAEPRAGSTSESWGGGEEQTREGVIVGTLPYMSPEQLGAGGIDGRADLWAVGIMLWELCTGRHPLSPLSRETHLAVRDTSLPMPSLAAQRPELGALGAVVDGCLRKRAAERTPSARALLDELEPLLPGRTRRGVDEAENPFVGLAAFQRRDSVRFFGRDRDVAGVVAQLRNLPLVAVAAASGAGKSSLVRAGVISALERSGPLWESFVVRPGRQPLSALAEVLAEAGRAAGAEGRPEPGSPDALAAALRAQPGHLGAVLRGRAQARQGRVLLFVDQLEELYTLGADRGTREAFGRCLEGVADDASSPLRVIVSVRSDFLDRLAEDRSFSSTVSRGLVLLAPMSREQLRAALEEPLEAVGHRFENGALVDAMLDSLEKARSPLPLLQFAAARLWETRDVARRVVTQAGYDALGGVEGALATRADAVLAGLSREDQRLARTVLTALVSAERTRAVVGLLELRASAGDGVERVVSHLAEARLVLVETEPERGPTVELVHESLIQRWPRLARWLAEDEDAAEFRTRVRAAARAWDEQGRTEDLLWRGDAAAEAELWMGREQAALADLGPRDRAWLLAVASLAARARRRRRQATAAGFVLVSTVAVGFWLLSIRASREAQLAAASAVRAQNVAQVATAYEQRSDPTLAFALLREIDPSQPPPPRWSALARWTFAQNVAEVVLEHGRPLGSAAFSPDGTHIATASSDGLVRLWKADGSGAPLELRGHRDWVRTAAFSPDGTLLVTASNDGTARVWRLGAPGDAVVLSGHRERLYSARFSPDGRRIVTASRDATVRVWNADGSGPSVVLGHPDRVFGAAFSPDGARIVTACLDKAARVWSADGTGRPVVLRGHEVGVSSASFSPDGRRVVTTAWDRTARVWNADGSGSPLLLTHPEARVHFAAFSPDGAQIVTASEDLTARVWNADGSGHAAVLSHPSPVRHAEFSADGSRIVTSTSTDVRVWRRGAWRPRIVLSGHRDLVRDVAFSPDGTHVVTASRDRTARVWRSDGTGDPVILRGHGNDVLNAAFDAQGTRVATASVDGTAAVWRSDGSGAPMRLEGHTDYVHTARFSPDGTRLVTASADRTARVWALDGSRREVVLAHPDRVQTAEFSPDGTRIVTASWDRAARVWNADGSGRPILLAGHEGSVVRARFTPDGSRVVTSTVQPLAVQLWNADGSGRPIVMKNLALALGRGGFTPDGRLLAMTGVGSLCLATLDGAGPCAILRLPDLDPAQAAAALSADGTRAATATASDHGGDAVEPGADKDYPVTLWSDVGVFRGLLEPALWTASTWCPPVELRTRLLGIPEPLAARQLLACQARAEAARAARP